IRNLPAPGQRSERAGILPADASSGPAFAGLLVLLSQRRGLLSDRSDMPRGMGEGPAEARVSERTPTQRSAIPGSPGGDHRATDLKIFDAAALKFSTPSPRTGKVEKPSGPKEWAQGQRRNRRETVRGRWRVAKIGRASCRERV